MSVDRAVVLVGSAKASGTSSSEALARYLAGRLEMSRVAVEIVNIVATRSDAGAAKLAGAVDSAGLFALVSPMYVDSLPYLVIRALESLASARSPRTTSGCRFAALVHCGFPEAAQCRTALDITRTFARHARFEWAGGLALGESGLINGRDLNALGGVGRNLRAALDAASAALAAGLAIPDAAVRQLARPFVPAPLYTFVGDLGWKRRARRNGVRRQLNARPFEP